MTFLQSLLPTSLDALDLRKATGALGSILTPEMCDETAGTGGDDAVAIQKCFTDARAANMTPMLAGRYKTSVPLLLKTHLWQLPGSKIDATAAMETVVQIGEASDRARHLDIVGLNIDAKGLADRAVWMRHYEDVRLTRPRLYNAQSRYLEIGDDAAASDSFEAHIGDVFTARDAGNIATGSIALRGSTRATDTTIYGAGIVKGAETGVQVNTGGNRIEGVHAWPGVLPGNTPNGDMLTCFDDAAGSGNKWFTNQADSASVYGFRLRNTLTVLLFNDVFNTTLDNVVIGMHFDQSSPAVQLGFNRVHGRDVTHRFAKDYDFTGSSGNHLGGNASSFCAAYQGLAFVETDPGGRAMYFQGDTISLNHGGNVYLGAASGAGAFNLDFAPGKMKINSIPSYASDAAATADSALPSNAPYRITGDKTLRVK